MDNLPHSSRIPRELMHQQNERLSSKHIQTLSFVQELAEENKQLKLRVKVLEEEQLKCDEFHSLVDESRNRMKDVQEECLKRTDELYADLTNKHNAEMIKIVGEKLDQEKHYLEEMVKMRDEIDELEKVNQSLIDENKQLNLADDELPIALSKIKQYQIQMEECELQKNELREEINNQIVQLQDLLSFKNNHESVCHNLQEAKQKNAEFQFKIQKLEKDLKEVEGDKNKQDVLDQLKIKLEKVRQERDLKTEIVKEQSTLMQNLKDKVEQFKSSLVNCQSQKEKIALEHQELLSELNHVKKQMIKSKSATSFKDFVDLKREIKNLKYENEDLKQLLLSTSTTSLPYIIENDSNHGRHKATSATSQHKKKLKEISFQ